jgi:tetratricopeptide (TPR) repeat protein
MYLDGLGLLMDEYLNKKENSIMLRTQAAEIYKNVNREHRAAGIYITIGGFYQRQNLLDESLEIFLLVADLYQNIDFSAIIGALRVLAKGFKKKKEFDKALKATNALVNICLMTDNKKQLSIAYHILGIIQLDNQNLLEAQKAFENEIKVALEINDVSQLALGLFRLVSLVKRQGKLKSIENLLEKSSEIFEDSKDWTNLKKVLCIRADIQEMNQEWHEAEKLLLHAYNLAYEKLKNKQNQAIITNSLGQVIANQKGEEKFQLAKMYFRESIKLGVELNDQSHLAKVYTAMGQAFSANGNFEQAVDKLSEGFAIDETLANIRGLKIVTPDLTDALDRLGRQQEALDYCDRCLKIAHNDSEFLHLKKKIQVAIFRKISIKMIKIGVIDSIKCNEKDNLHWGRIAPNDKSPHISFNENFVGSEIVSKLTKGTLVLVVFEKKSGKFYAKRIELFG